MSSGKMTFSFRSRRDPSSGVAIDLLTCLIGSQQLSTTCLYSQRRIASRHGMCRERELAAHTDRVRRLAVSSRLWKIQVVRKYSSFFSPKWLITTNAKVSCLAKWIHKFLSCWRLGKMRLSIRRGRMLALGEGGGGLEQERDRESKQETGSIG